MCFASSDRRFEQTSFVHIAQTPP